ncbi:MAG: ABC transporter substrate-binding protein [Thermodesulfobacteriota bacterium]|nr:ABC transporter substrate-binding protein [Thermodesulfobacteriota bacterium]
MERKNLLSMGILVVALILFSSMSSYSEEVRGVTDKSVKIGIICDLTGPSTDAWTPITYGLKAYSKMINDRGGIHGRKINYIIEDDRYSIPLALSSFKKLVYRDKVFALLGPGSTGGTVAIIPLVEKEKIPLLANTSERRFLVPARKYIFSVLPCYQDQAKLALEYTFHDMKLKGPTIALMYPDMASGKTTRDAVRELVKVYPVKDYKEVIISMAPLDYTSEVLRVKQSKPDIIYLFGFPAQAGLIVKTARIHRLSTPIIVFQFGCTDETIKLAGKAATEFMGINCFGVWDDDSPGVKELRKVSLAYDPNVHYRDSNFFAGWLLGMIFYQSFKNAGRDLTRETYLKGLEAVNFDTQGICGVITFGPDDRKPIDSHRFFKADIDKGEFVPITGWRKPKKYDF